MEEEELAGEWMTREWEDPGDTDDSPPLTYPMVNWLRKIIGATHADGRVTAPIATF